MYQVDFVAALFGAFLLLWISRAKEGLSPELASSTVVTMEIRTQAQHSILPAGSLRCAAKELIDEVDEKLGSCADSLEESWNTAHLLPLGQFTPQDFAARLNVPTEVVRGAYVATIKLVTKTGKTIRFRSLALKDPNRLIALGIAAATDEPQWIEIADSRDAYLRIDCRPGGLPNCPEPDQTRVFRDQDQPALFTPSAVIVRASNWNSPCYSASGIQIPTHAPVLLTECTK